MRFSIFSILRVTAYFAAVLVALRALPILLLMFAFLGVPLAIIFTSKLGTHHDPKSMPLAVFLIRLWLCDLAAIFLFVVWLKIGFTIW